MTDPLGRAETAALLRHHGVTPDRRRGQHFLSDPNIVRRIVEISGCGPGDQVVEIGAGSGTLTRALAASGARVIAYEVDERLRPLLDDTLAGVDGVDLRFADAAAVDLEAELAGGEWTMVANLPYNVGTPILLEAIQRVPRMTRFVVMLQAEAVERLAAAPGSKQYGLPSVVVALHARIDVALRVPGHVFIPETPVASAVAVIDRTPPDPMAAEAIRIAHAAFGQRRKMVRVSLRAAVEDVSAALESARVAPTSRAEDLSPQDFLAIAAAA